MLRRQQRIQRLERIVCGLLGGIDIAGGQFDARQTVLLKRVAKTLLAIARRDAGQRTLD